MHRVIVRHVLLLATVGLLLAGCPKNIPQPEIDAAEQAAAGLDDTAPCAPETTQAARKTLEQARALLKEEKYEEAKAAFVAARQLADKAREECDRKKREAAEEEARRKQAEADALAAARPAEVPAPAGPAELVTVYFPFNASDLTDEAREALGNDAEYLRQRPAARVQIEGHCDERGSTEYNLALGERRALAVKQYLVKLGVEPDRMEIISYGEERPAESAATEGAWARNRRAEFREPR